MQEAVGDASIKEAHAKKWVEAAERTFSQLRDRRIAEASSRVEGLINKMNAQLNQLASDPATSSKAISSAINAFLAEYEQTAEGPTKWKRLVEFMQSTIQVRCNSNPFAGMTVQSIRVFAYRARTLEGARGQRVIGRAGVRRCWCSESSRRRRSGRPRPRRAWRSSSRASRPRAPRRASCARRRVAKRRVPRRWSASWRPRTAKPSLRPRRSASACRRAAAAAHALCFVRRREHLLNTTAYWLATGNWRQCQGC